MIYIVPHARVLSWDRGRTTCSWRIYYVEVQYILCTPSLDIPRLKTFWYLRQNLTRSNYLTSKSDRWGEYISTSLVSVAAEKSIQFGLILVFTWDKNRVKIREVIVARIKFSRFTPVDLFLGVLRCKRTNAAVKFTPPGFGTIAWTNPSTTPGRSHIFIGYGCVSLQHSSPPLIMAQVRVVRRVGSIAWRRLFENLPDSFCKVLL